MAILHGIYKKNMRIYLILTAAWKAFEGAMAVLRKAMLLSVRLLIGAGLVLAAWQVGMYLLR